MMTEPIQITLRSARTATPCGEGTPLAVDARSSDSIGLNLGEGRHRRGGDRGHAYRIAHGSAGELTVALRQALARRLITEQQYADVDRILDQLRAILWRLTH